MDIASNKMKKQDDAPEHVLTAQPSLQKRENDDESLSIENNIHALADALYMLDEKNEKIEEELSHSFHEDDDDDSKNHMNMYDAVSHDERKALFHQGEKIFGIQNVQFRYRLYLLLLILLGGFLVITHYYSHDYAHLFKSIAESRASHASPIQDVSPAVVLESPDVDDTFIELVTFDTIARLEGKLLAYNCSASLLQQDDASGARPNLILRISNIKPGEHNKEPYFGLKYDSLSTNELSYITFWARMTYYDEDTCPIEIVLQENEKKVTIPYNGITREWKKHTVAIENDVSEHNEHLDVITKVTFHVRGNGSYPQDIYVDNLCLVKNMNTESAQ